ncbi:hypothetical protein A1D22_05960 [Pasteurellaceae bacterium LFhippo2]|nr:hypothetical protein [Pasteurellaceae bacterium LFhippo2]
MVIENGFEVDVKKLRCMQRFQGVVSNADGVFLKTKIFTTFDSARKHINRIIDEYNLGLPAEQKIPTYIYSRKDKRNVEVAKLWRRPIDWDNKCYSIKPTLEEAQRYGRQ